MGPFSRDLLLVYYDQIGAIEAILIPQIHAMINFSIWLILIYK